MHWYFHDLQFFSVLTRYNLLKIYSFGSSPNTMCYGSLEQNTVKET